MRVLLATTWATACGIAEHSGLLKEAVEAADPSIAIDPCPGYLDPEQCLLTIDSVSKPGDLLHLNYHAALHSRWDVGAIVAVQAAGRKVIVTFHDTIGEISPVDLRAQGDTRLDRLEQIAQVADALIVHEPCLELLGDEYHVWRMGVPAWEPPRQIFGTRSERSMAGAGHFKAWRDQPVLGSIGFPFPWKNFDQLATITGEIGWALLLIAPTATPEQQIRWHELNPDVWVRTDFVPRGEAVSLLAGCDATAFAYTGGNTGQSGAILQGIAARKPVLALAHCRQFRALFDDPLARTTITWCEDLEGLAFALTHFVRLERTSPAVVALAEQESWTRLGRKYATLYHEVARA